MIKVSIPKILQQAAAIGADLDIDAGNIKGVVDSIVQKYPDACNQLYDSQGNIGKYLRFYRNNEMIDSSSYESLNLDDGDVISLIIPVAGG